VSGWDPNIKYGKDSKNLAKMEILCYPYRPAKYSQRKGPKTDPTFNIGNTAEADKNEKPIDLE
jgi:hypothetical protein